MPRAADYFDHEMQLVATVYFLDALNIASSPSPADMANGPIGGRKTLLSYLGIGWNTPIKPAVQRR